MTPGRWKDIGSVEGGAVPTGSVPTELGLPEAA